MFELHRSDHVYFSKFSLVLWKKDLLKVTKYPAVHDLTNRLRRVSCMPVIHSAHRLPNDARDRPKGREGEGRGGATSQVNSRQDFFFSFVTVWEIHEATQNTQAKSCRVKNIPSKDYQSTA